MADKGLPKLPDGFEIETPSASATPPLPDGFQLEGQSAQPEDNTPSAGEAATLSASDLPIIGPKLQELEDQIFGHLMHLANPNADPQFFADFAKSRRQQAQEAHPVASTVGRIGGSLAALGPVGATDTGATLLGMKGANIGLRALTGGVTNAAISGADTAVRGGSAKDVGENSILGGVIGGLGIPVGDALGRVAQLAGGAVAPLLANWLRLPSTISRAEGRVGSALANDTKAGDVGLSPGQMAEASANEQPVVNADMGGAETRTLLRGATKKSEIAGQQVETGINDRFQSQGQRLTDFLDRMMGSPVDTTAERAAIKASGKVANPIAYNKAYQAGNTPIWNKELSDIVNGTPSGRAAMKAARANWRDLYVGSGKVGSPKPPKVPNMQLWDYVSRELQNQADNAAGNQAKMRIGGVRQQLLKALDNVPGAGDLYKAARTGAAGFFGAQDAIEAGQQFSGRAFDPTQAKSVIAKMEPEEKELFARGYAGGLKNRALTTGNNANLIDNLFNNPAAKEKNILALGPDRAKALQSYITIERTQNLLRGKYSAAMWQNLSGYALSAGLGGIQGYRKGGLMGAAGGAAMGVIVIQGLKAANSKVDEDIAKHIVNTLMTNDPAKMESLMKRAATNQKLLNTAGQVYRFLSSQLPQESVEAQSQERKDAIYNSPVANGVRRALDVTVHPLRSVGIGQ